MSLSLGQDPGAAFPWLRERLSHCSWGMAGGAATRFPLDGSLWRTWRAEAPSTARGRAGV